MKGYRVAAIVILAGMLAACGQQEKGKTEPLQIQPIEEAKTEAEEQRVQEPEEQAEEQRVQEPEEQAEEQNIQEAEGSAGEMTQEPSEAEKAEAEGTEQTQNPDDSIADLYGTWQVTDYKTCQICAMSQQEIEAFSTCKVSYYEDKFVLEGQETENFGYTFLNAYTFQGYAWADLNQDFQVDLTEWWNGNEIVPMGQISSEEGFFGDIFFLSDEDHMWIYHEGVFFKAEKISG